MKKSTLASILGAAVAAVSLIIGTHPAQTRVQACLNPTQVSAPAPANYDAKFADGVTPVVASVKLETWSGGTLVSPGVDIGHPAKDANGLVTVGLTRGALELNKQYGWVFRAVNQFEELAGDPPAITCAWQDTKPGKFGPAKPCNKTNGQAC